MIPVIIGALGLLGTILSTVKGLFAPGSSAGNVAAIVTKDLTNDAATLADYENGQAVVVADFSIPGDTKKAIIVAMQEGGPAYTDLFGS